MPAHDVRLAAPLALDADVCSRACDARDSRFDGLFFVAITSTRIYCRPVCPARVSHRDRRRFYPSAAAAEGAGYRPCMRCRPELAPGRAAVDAVPRLAEAAARRVEAGALNGRSVADLAGEFDVSERHLRRAFARELGIAPIQLALTHRLLLAKRLLTDTRLSVTQIAFASGFQSLRRFNAVFQERYRMPPSALRRPSPARATSQSDVRADLLRLTLGYRPPLAWDALLSCFARDAIDGVDVLDGRRYGRTVSLDGCTGVIFAEDSAKERSPGTAHLDVDISLSLVPVLMPLLARLRHLFDLDAEPATVDAHLGREGLGEMVRCRPGIRVPGALGGFEAAFRALLGGWPDDRRPLDVGVARRVVSTLGEPVECSAPGLERLLPTAECVAARGSDALVALGVPTLRAVQLAELAQAIHTGRISLERGAHSTDLVRALLAIEGIGERLATTIVMRASSWPDALSSSSGAPSIAAWASHDGTFGAQAERWRPWSAYAAMHLWAR